MAQRILVLDDLDGSEGATTRRYSFGGRFYEVDRTDDNQAKFEKAIKRFIDKSRVSLRSPGRPPATRTKASTKEPSGRGVSRTRSLTFREGPRPPVAGRQVQGRQEAGGGA